MILSKRRKQEGAELEHDGLGENSLIHTYIYKHIRELNSRNYENNKQIDESFAGVLVS